MLTERKPPMDEKETYKIFKKNHSRKILISFIVIVMIYTFFFSSPVIFHKRSETSYSPLNEALKFTDTISITIEDWKYSRQQNRMEVQLSINNSDLSVKNEDFSFGTACNYMEMSKGRTTLPSKVMINEFNFIVIWIDDIPEDFNSVVVSVFAKDVASKLNIFTNCDYVNNVNEINKKSHTNYRIERIDEEIVKIKAEIKEQKQEVKRLEEENAKIKSKIEEKRQTELYESEGKILEIENDIASLQSNIKSNEISISEIQKQIISLNTTIKEYEQTKTKIKNL